MVPVREQTYRMLKEKILKGEFEPNRRLAEEALAQLLGVSRTPVREALHKLELEGLICKKGSRGFCVPEGSKEEMNELFEIRMVLEGHALAFVCSLITRQQIEALKVVISEAEQCLANGKVDLIFDYNTRFHDMLYRLLQSERPRLFNLIEDMREYVLRYRKTALTNREAAARSIAGHKKIIMALELKDSLLCEQVMRSHVREAQLDAHDLPAFKKQTGS